MKLTQALIVFLLISLKAFSQDSVFVEVLYSQQYEMDFDQIMEKIPSEQRNVVAPVVKRELDNGIFLEFILRSKGDESVYQMVEKLNNSQNENFGIFARQLSESEKGIMYKSVSQNIYIKPFALPGNNTNFLIKDTLPVFNWEIIGEDEQINNYKTVKAKVIYEGNEVTAWYTPEIQLGDGPSIYYNLPGLILKVIHEQEGTVVTSLVKDIKFLEKMPTIEKPNKGKEVSEAEFLEEVKKFEEKMKDMYSQGVDTDN